MEMKSFLRANWDRALAVALVLAGAVALVIGWFGVSGTGLTAEQNPYLISGGLAGIGLIAVGCTLWMSADLQDEWRRLDALEERLAEHFTESSNGDGRAGRDDPPVRRRASARATARVPE
jgi:hypothetical protein